VVLDSPHGSYYGSEVAAPVFTEVAQQILEYLGVPHDVPLRPVTEQAQKKQPPITEDDSNEQSEDVNTLYAAVNDLPSDDPLKSAPTQPQSAQANPAAQSNSAAQSSTSASTQSSTSASAQSGTSASAQSNTSPSAQANTSSPTGSKPAQQQQQAEPSTRTVMIPDEKRLRVPSLTGLSVRDVIIQAGSAGLAVRITGSGIARQQAPAPGTLVPPGTQIVVHCER